MSLASKEFVQSIADLAGKGQKSEIVFLPGGRKAALVIGGAVNVMLDVPPADRKHVVQTLEDIVKASTEFALVNEDNEDVAPQTIFHDETSIVLVLNHLDRRDTVTMPLIKTHEFKLIEQLQKATHLGQKDLLRLLRVDLKRASTGGDAIQTLTAVNFTQIKQGESFVGAGMEKVGKSLEAKATMAKALPEELQFSVQVFENDGLNFRLPCSIALDIDPMNERFTLQTIPGETAVMLNACAARIDSYFVERLPTVTVLNGMPN